MGDVVSNFEFLKGHSPQLAKLGRLAERYFSDDPPTTLVKLRQFAEITARQIAARQALYANPRMSFDEILSTLRARSVLQREVADLFYHLKRAGNAAAHEDLGSAAEALTALKLARAIGVWFHQTYERASEFRPGPFVPPQPRTDVTATLHAEIESLREAVRASDDVVAEAQLLAQQAEQKTADEVGDRAYWMNYAAETEAALREAERTLAETQARAASAPAIQLELLACPSSGFLGQ